MIECHAPHRRNQGSALMPCGDIKEEWCVSVDCEQNLVLMDGQIDKQIGDEVDVHLYLLLLYADQIYRQKEKDLCVYKKTNIQIGKQIKGISCCFDFSQS